MLRSGSNFSSGGPFGKGARSSQGAGDRRCLPLGTPQRHRRSLRVPRLHHPASKAAPAQHVQRVCIAGSIQACGAGLPKSVFSSLDVACERIGGGATGEERMIFVLPPCHRAHRLNHLWRNIMGIEPIERPRRIRLDDVVEKRHHLSIGRPVLLVCPACASAAMAKARSAIVESSGRSLRAPVSPSAHRSAGRLRPCSASLRSFRDHAPAPTGS